MVTFGSFICFGVATATSGGIQAIYKKYGKEDLADTLNMLTHAGAVVYIGYFLIKVLQVSVSAFL